MCFIWTCLWEFTDTLFVQSYNIASYCDVFSLVTCYIALSLFFIFQAKVVK